MKLIVYRHVFTPSDAMELHYQIEQHTSWKTLFPDMDLDAQEFARMCGKHTWTWAVTLDGDLAGYLMVRAIHEGEGELHVCALPGYSKYTRAIWENWLEHVWSMLHTLHAYIPVERKSLARLARRYGFEVNLEEEYYHGKITKSSTSSTSTSSSSACPG